MGRRLRETLYGMILVACVVATLLAIVAFLAPTILPEPFATATAESNLWIVATASLTILGMLFVLLVLRLFL